MNTFQGFKPSGMEKIANAMGFQGNIKDFQKFLQQQRFIGLDGRRLWNALRTIGAEHHQFFEKGKNIQCWSIPAFAEQTEEFSVPKIEDYQEKFSS